MNGGLNVRELLKRVYNGLFRGKTEPVKFPSKYGFSLVVAEDGDYHKPSTWVFTYHAGKIVKINNVSWLLSRGEGGGAGLDSDIIAIPTKNPRDIEECLRFGNSLIIGKTDGSFFVQPGYNAFRSPFERFILGLDMKIFIAQNRRVDGNDGYLDPDTFGRAVRQSFMYKPQFVGVLRKGLEEILKNADPARFSVENPRISGKK